MYCNLSGRWCVREVVYCTKQLSSTVTMSLEMYWSQDPRGDAYSEQLCHSVLLRGKFIIHSFKIIFIIKNIFFKDLKNNTIFGNSEVLLGTPTITNKNNLRYNKNVLFIKKNYSTKFLLTSIKSFHYHFLRKKNWYERVIV